MGHIFISYSRQDGQSSAEKLEDELRALGFAVWRDVRNIDPAHDFTADIEHGIEAASHVVVCITSDSLRDNSYVRREIQYSLIKHKPVIPLRFEEDITPHLPLVNFEWIDLWDYATWAENMARLSAILRGDAGEYRAGPDQRDPFHAYLTRLYDQIVYYFTHQVIGDEPIELEADPTPEAVNGTPYIPPRRQRDMIEQLFATHGITPQTDAPPPEDSHADFTRFADAVEYYDQRVLLLGDPGAGKTITLMAYTRDMITRRLDDRAAPLPLFGVIALWDARAQTPLDVWLAQSYAEFNLDAVRREIARQRVLFLLDGLDELGGMREEDPEAVDAPAPDDADKHERQGLFNRAKTPTTESKREPERFDPRQRFMDALAPYLTPASSEVAHGAIVSCRVKDYAEIGQKIMLNGAVTLLPLTDEQMRAYLQTVPELWAAIESDEELRNIARTPLLMSLFAAGYRDNAADAAQLRDLRASPGELRDRIFRQFIEERYRWEERKHGKLAFTLDEIFDVLGQVAMQNIEAEIAIGNVIPIYHFEQAIGEEEEEDFIELVTRLHLLALRE